MNVGQNENYVRLISETLPTLDWELRDSLWWKSVAKLSVSHNKNRKVSHKSTVAPGSIHRMTVYPGRRSILSCSLDPSTMTAERRQSKWLSTSHLTFGNGIKRLQRGSKDSVVYSQQVKTCHVSPPVPWVVPSRSKTFQQSVGFFFFFCRETLKTRYDKRPVCSLEQKTATRNWDLEFCSGPVTGFLPAGTVAPSRWSSPPESSAGTQRWVSPPPLSSSRSASAHVATRDNPPGMASGSRGPPGPTPPGSPSLEDEAAQKDDMKAAF